MLAGGERVLFVIDGCSGLVGAFCLGGEMELLGGFLAGLRSAAVAAVALGKLVSG